MAYLGRQPNTGVRSRYIFTATPSQNTTFSGTDDDGKTLKYEDAAYLDVFLNGVLLKPVTDYTATSKTSVVLTSGAAVSDIVEIVAYDIANIANTVSATNGGTFEADVTVQGTVTADGLTVDTDTLYVDAANNRVGVGTASPAAKLHLGGSSNQTIQIEGTSNTAYFGTNGNRGDLFVNYDPTDGTIPNSGRSTAGIQLDGADGGSNVIFRTTNANNAASTERARIDSSGQFIVNKTSSASSSAITAKSLGIDSYQGFNTNNAFTFAVSGVGQIYSTSTSISSISDVRLKENVRDLDVGLGAIMALRPRKFDWKEGKGLNTQDARGFIAQEFEQVFPDLIDEWRDPAPEGEEPYKSVRQDLIPVLVKAIQEQQALIEDLQTRLAVLENA